MTSPDQLRLISDRRQLKSRLFCFRARFFAAVIGGVVLAGCGSSTPPVASRHSQTPTTQTAASIVPMAPKGSTLLVTLPASEPSYLSPGGSPTGTVPQSWQGAPSVLPVIAEDAGFVQVRLAQRPNESTAWIQAKGLAFSSTPYRIEVDLATTHLTLYKDGKAVLTMPAGIGVPQYPTPTGQFFVALITQPPDSGYGPFVMVTSAHSVAITDWERSGDAIVAIHGPLGASATIGTTGAAVSHGCIRLQLANQLALRVVPVGSPVDIVAA